VGTAQHAFEQTFDRQVKTWLDAQAHQLLVARPDLAAHAIGRGQGLHLDRVDQPFAIDGQAQLHQVNGVASGHRLGAQLQIVRLGIGERAFNVHQAIVAFKAFAVDGAQMHGFALHGCIGKRSGWGVDRHGSQLG
jgi:hypothetical protein